MFPLPLPLSRKRWLRFGQRALLCLLGLLLLTPLNSQAALDENDFYTVDEYRYDRDGSNVMDAEDDPGDGGPSPTDVPLGSDAALTVLALVGAWYARRALREATSQPSLFNESH